MNDDAAHFLSTAQVAEALGVGVSTVKRWVDEEILPAHKTPGGHRKLLLSDVLRLIKQEKFPLLDLSKLYGKRLPATGDDVALQQRLLAAIRSGDEDEARTLLISLHRGGMPIAQLADRLIAPVLHRIGHDWESGTIDVMHEHRGTQIVAAALYEVRQTLLSRVRSEQPVAVGGAPEGDPYFLTSLLIQMVLQEAGWNAVNLGPNTPLRSLERALRELRPKLLWMSVSHLADEAQFRREYPVLYDCAEKSGVAVALGGQALSAELRGTLPYTTFGDGLTHLAAFARTLYPTKHRPARGRPRAE